MKFEANTIYHVFNQGNNGQKIFFKPANYEYFKQKIKRYISPYSDILAYCLMPNHFHILIRTNELATQYSSASQPCSKTELEKTAILSKMRDINKNLIVMNVPSRQRNLNHAIGQMLSSYSRAINKQEKRSGSLFRGKTKAIDGSKETVITLDDKQRFFTPLESYWQTCFDYIHSNPVLAKLVKSQDKWRYSSFSELIQPSPFDLVNHKLVQQLNLWQ